MSADKVRGRKAALRHAEQLAYDVAGLPMALRHLLRLLLDQNFLQDEQGRYYVPDPANAEDLEKIRRRALLQEFAGYRQSGKRRKLFRTEAVRAGFARAWRERVFATIVEVAERLPEQVLQEDPDLLMYYDAAMLRINA